MGGEERVAKHRSAGKLDARQRLDRLFDPGTFVELGALVGNIPEDGAPHAPADAPVGGIGEIDGRSAVAAAEDFTVLGGSIGTGASDKRYRLVRLAAQERVPLVFMLEGAGHRVVNAPAGRRPNDLQALAELSGLVPMVCVVLGASAGHGALTAPLSDFVVMTSSASLFTAGPPLVKAALGEDVTKEELGGPSIHVEQSGVAHNLAPDDVAAIDLARRYLSYFPLNAWTAPPIRETGDVGRRDLDEILDVIPPNPRRPDKIRAVLEMLVDRGSLFEIQPAFGSAVVTALAQIGGQSVAIVANDPSALAGTIDADAADKATHSRCYRRIPSPDGLSRGQSGRHGRHCCRTFRRIATRGPDVRSPAPTYRAEVPCDPAQGFRLRLDDHGDEPFRQADAHARLPAVTLGASPAASVAESSKLDDEGRQPAIAEQAAGSFRAANTMVTTT